MDWEELRGIRDGKLGMMDKYQGVLLYNSLSSTQQAQLAVYRTALLNLPSNYSTPEEAMDNMPTKPDWMD